MIARAINNDEKVIPKTQSLMNVDVGISEVGIIVCLRA
jgi:hypothetical protein